MFNKISLYIYLFVLLLSTACKSYQPQIVSKQNIFENEKVDFEQCHASSIHQIDEDTFIATWFGGSYESNPDVGIWTSLYKDGNWSNPIKVADGTIKDKLYPTWNPVFFQQPNSDTLFLYYKIGPNPREWKGYYKFSINKGNSWSSAHALPINILGPIKNKPIALKNGTILSPSSTESLEEIWKAHMEISYDNSKSWKIVPINHEDSIEVIQPSVIQTFNGDIQILCRSKEDVVMTAFSKDNGESWLPWQKTNLKNPNSATDAIRLQNGLLMIVYNPDIAGKDWWEGRTKLYVATSTDGLQWKDVLKLEDGQKGDEYSYPTIIQDQENKIHITYTWNRKTIKHVVLN